MRIAFHVVRQPPASAPPRPRSPKSQGAWARTAPASRLAVQSVAAIRLRKKDVVPMPASSCDWNCRRGVVSVCGRFSSSESMRNICSAQAEST